MGLAFCVVIPFQKTRTFIESQEPDLLRELILDPRISEMVVRMEEAVQVGTPSQGYNAVLEWSVC